MSQEQKWISRAALTSAVLAVLAGLSGLSSNFHGNEVTRELIKNANQWSYYQAKGIKANLLQTKMELLSSKKNEGTDQNIEKLKEYKLEQDKILEKTKEQEESIDHHLKVGGMYSRSVTLFQIAIGVVAVSLLTRKRNFWLAGLSLATFGIGFAIQAMLAS